MHDDLPALKRPTTIIQFVYQVFASAPARQLVAGDIGAVLPFELASIYEALRYLRELHVLRYAEGSRRLHELVPGASMPVDRRGGARVIPAASLRRVASRPISQFTAARPRPHRAR